MEILLKEHLHNMGPDVQYTRRYTQTVTNMIDSTIPSMYNIKIVRCEKQVLGKMKLLNEPLLLGLGIYYIHARQKNNVMAFISIHFQSLIIISFLTFPYVQIIIYEKVVYLELETIFFPFMHTSYMLIVYIQMRVYV